MQGKEYRFKFYLNARHAVNLGDTNLNIHPHTWEIVLTIKKSDEGFIHFAKIEDEIKQYLSKYEGQFLNEIPPFINVVPLMENIGETINQQIIKKLCHFGWELKSLEISENPTRTYILTNNTGKCEAPEDATSEGDIKNTEAYEGVEQSHSFDTDGSKNGKNRTEPDSEDLAAVKRMIASAGQIAKIAMKIEHSEELVRAAGDFAFVAKKILRYGIRKKLNSYQDNYENDNKIQLEHQDIKETQELQTFQQFQINKAQLIEIKEKEIYVECDLEEDTQSLEPGALSEVAAVFEQETGLGLTREKMFLKKQSQGLKNWLFMTLSTVFLVALLIPAMLFITRDGMLPWGSDSWYHVFKGNLLYHSILNGDFFPLFTSEWYNGVQPLRYWAPLPHYFLAVFEFITNGNAGAAYNIFIAFVFILGSFGWLLWGVKAGRRKLALILAVLWFILPDNLRVLFSEGNLSRVAVTTIFPYLLLNIWAYFEAGKKRNIFFIAVIMTLITFCHAMIAAMVGITLFLFVFWYGIANQKLKQGIIIVISAVFGIMLAGIWLYPALKGGILAIDQGAVSDLMKGLTYPALDTINPFLRLSHSDNFYFGTSVLVIALIGLWLGDRKSKAGFGIAILIFLGTTRELMPIIAKIPMSQLFWMMRFTPLAMGVFFMGLILWKNLKKGVLILFIIVLIADSSLSFSLLAHDSGYPAEVKKALDLSLGISTQRIAVIDDSAFGSFPSFYISNNDAGKKVGQVFGSGWQGAKTTKNIVGLNTAIENSFYPYLFDRCLEQGADTVIIKNDLINKKGTKNETLLIAQGLAQGFKKVYDTGLCSIFKYDIKNNFGTIVKYNGFAIGKYASNISFMFPEFEVGEDLYLDDYSETKLLSYKTIFLSGFLYKDKAKAENMVKKLSEKGVKFVVDLTGAPVDIYTSRPSFLGVTAQPVEFLNNYPILRLNNQNVVLGKLPEDNLNWRTIYLENLDRVEGKLNFRNQEMDIAGTKLNNNIRFIGLNLAFFSVETQDKNAIDILENYTGLKADKTPQRTVVPLTIKYDRNSIGVTAGAKGVLTDIAYLDSFKALRGNFEEVNNLILIKDKKVNIQITYPYFAEGLSVSIMGLTGLALLLFFLRRRVLNVKKEGDICY